MITAYGCNIFCNNAITYSHYLSINPLLTFIIYIELKSINAAYLQILQRVTIAKTKLVRFWRHPIGNPTDMGPVPKVSVLPLNKLKRA